MALALLGSVAATWLLGAVRSRPPSRRDGPRLSDAVTADAVIGIEHG